MALQIIYIVIKLRKGYYVKHYGNLQRVFEPQASSRSLNISHGIYSNREFVNSLNWSRLLVLVLELQH